MPVQGATWSVIYAYGWNIVYGMMLSFLIMLVAFMSMQLANQQGSEALVGFTASVVILAGSLFYVYKKYKAPYEYGWSDAEEHHKISNSLRKCKPGEYCKDLP